MAKVKRLDTVQTKIEYLAELRAAKASTEAVLKALQEKIDQQTASVLNALLDAKLESIRSGDATVSIRRSVVPDVTDWSALDKHILATQSLDLLQRRVTVSAWRARVEAGEKVPGVQSFEKQELQWRTAK